LQEEKQQLQTQVNSMIKRYEQSATEHGIHKDELHKYQHKIKQLESDFQIQKNQLQNSKIKLHEYALLTEKNQSSLSSLHSEKESAINELKRYTQQSNEFKRVILTNEQLSQDVQTLRERIRELTVGIGIGIESEFPSVNKIVEDYEAISSNYRLKLTITIIKQLKSDENLKKKFEMTLLARFAHCVPFTILKLSYQFVQSYCNDKLLLLQNMFELSNKESAQRYCQIIFQEQFELSLMRLYEKGKHFIHSKLKQEIIQENTSFDSIYETIEENKEGEKDEKETDNKINDSKNKLIISCLRNMWSCLLSRPSLTPYPLIFTSNLQLNQEIQSKNVDIKKEILGKDKDCEQIGYVTWPTLIRCDTNEVLNTPMSVYYTRNIFLSIECKDKYCSNIAIHFSQIKCDFLNKKKNRNTIDQKTISGCQHII
ncbi:hypothetical protein RFI_00276, partial [Reticulomyxa filosa]